jgi:hypothetical protein
MAIRDYCREYYVCIGGGRPLVPGTKSETGIVSTVAKLSRIERDWSNDQDIEHLKK